MMNAGGCLPQTAGAAAFAHLVERKFVTVVFIDIVGSLSAIRDEDPEDAHDLLASSLGVMAQAVHRAGGVVAGTRGDGIIAIFGAPLAQEDHAARACEAALWLLRHAVGSSAAGSAFRIGIHSGEVAVGSMPTDFSSEYTAAGPVAHIAARLQAAAAPNSALLTAQTARLVHDSMLIEEVGPVVLKGLEAPLGLYRLIGRLAHDAAQDAAPRRDFVGRAETLAALEEAVVAAGRGRGSVIGLVGEAGLGKSTLINEVARRQGQGVTWIRTVAEHHTNAAPLQAFAEALRRLLRLHGDGSPRDEADLNAYLASLGLHPERVGAPLGDLLERDAVSEDWRNLAPARRQELIAAAVAAVLFAESRRRRLVVVLEDVQRTDSASIDLIDHLARTVARYPLAVIVAFRPEFAHSWARRAGYREIRLDRLSDADITTLGARLLSRDLAGPMWRKVLSWSRGNPLFLREIVRVLSDSRGSDEGDPSELEVPPSIGAVIAARIDRLPADAKRALLAASVLGEQFDTRLLCAVLGEAIADLARTLEILKANDFVRHDDAGDGVLTFGHALFHEVSYGTLLKRQRVALHQAAFAAVQSARPAAPPIEELARHAFNGHLWADSVALCREAGLKAAARNSNREAALHLENALAALGRIDPAGERLREAIALRLDLRLVYMPLLRLDRVAALLRDAEAAARNLNDQALRATIAGFLAGHAYQTRNAGVCVALCRQAMRLAASVPDPRLTVAPALYLCQARYGLGRYRQALKGLERERFSADPSLSGPDVGLPIRPCIIRGYWLAISSAELGRFEPAQRAAVAMLDHADGRHPFELLYAQTALGFVLMLKGELAMALQASAEALETADTAEIAFIIPALASQVGFLRAQLGEVGAGLALARRAMRAAERIGVRAGQSRWCARLAEVALLAGDGREAVERAGMALGIAQDGAELGYLCSALRLRAKTRAVLDNDVEGALGDLADATALARKLRLGPALAKCHHDKAVLVGSLGDRGAARRWLTLARSGFMRLGMQAAMRAEAMLQDLANGRLEIGPRSLIGNAE